MRRVAEYFQVYSPPTSDYGGPRPSDREASLRKKGYCRCGPYPLQVTSSRARPYLLRERAALAPSSRISGPPLHCGDSTNSAPEVAPGASLHSEALSPECGREHQGTGDAGPTQHVGAGLRGLLGPTAHGLLGRRHPGPRLSHISVEPGRSRAIGLLEASCKTLWKASAN